MKKLDFGQAVTLLANIGVIAGIVFLGIELQQNNELLSAQFRLTRAENRGALSGMLFENPEAIELLGKEGPSLTEAELDRLLLLGINTLVQMEWSYGEAARGFQDLDALATSFRSVYHRERLNYGAPLAWEVYRPGADPEFAAWFEESVVNIAK